MKRIWVSVERVERAARKALADGGSLATFRDNGRPRRLVRVDYSLRCSVPHEYVLDARWSATHGKRVRPIAVEYRVPCRKCVECQKMRQRFWMARAIDEYSLSERTWFGTITLSPDEHYRLDAQCTVELARQGVKFAGLSEGAKFHERCRVFGVYMTQWLKDLRKGDLAHGKPRFRYLMVAEAHDSAKTSDDMRGRPHVHLLIHEQKEALLVLPDEYYLAKDRKSGVLRTFIRDEAFLRKKWKYGYTKFQLAEDAKTAGYLCKYLSKSMMVRVRASLNYGSGPYGTKTSKVVRQSEACRPSVFPLTPPQTTGGAGDVVPRAADTPPTSVD